jgi:hypothetical protein
VCQGVLAILQLIDVNTRQLGAVGHEDVSSWNSLPRSLTQLMVQACKGDRPVSERDAHEGLQLVDKGVLSHDCASCGGCGAPSWVTAATGIC